MEYTHCCGEQTIVKRGRKEANRSGRVLPAPRLERGIIASSRLAFYILEFLKLTASINRERNEFLQQYQENQ